MNRLDALQTWRDDKGGGGEGGGGFRSWGRPRHYNSFRRAFSRASNSTPTQTQRHCVSDVTAASVTSVEVEFDMTFDLGHNLGTYSTVRVKSLPEVLSVASHRLDTNKLD